MSMFGLFVGTDDGFINSGRQPSPDNPDKVVYF